MYFLVQFWGIKFLQNFLNDFFGTFWVKNAFFSTLKFLSDEISIFFYLRFESVSPPYTLLAGTIFIEKDTPVKENIEIHLMMNNFTWHYWDLAVHRFSSK